MPTPYKAGHVQIGLRFQPRRSAQYASAIEPHYPLRRPLWRRVLRAIWGWC